MSPTTPSSRRPARPYLALLTALLIELSASLLPARSVESAPDAAPVAPAQDAPVFLPIILHQNGPTAEYTGSRLRETCQWFVFIRISGFTPNSTITVNSQYNEKVCATGETIEGDWTLEFFEPTDANGELYLAFLHQGTGEYTYTFTDAAGKSAQVHFTTTP